jgi:hypothetical protein
MASQVEIANRALTKLGAARIISFGDDNKQARSVNSMFNVVRDAELRAHLWSFTIRRASLPNLTTTPDWGYDYEYQLPADCLRLLEVGDIYPGPNMDDYRNSSTQEYVIEGRKILTNEAAPLKIRYASRVEDTTQWDATFVEAFACRLAMEMCEDLTQSNTKKELLTNDYGRAIMMAIRSNCIELPFKDLPDDSWAMSRL